MTNAYCDLALLKSGGALNITGAAHDRRLQALLEEASRIIDGHCNRHFYVLNATRQFEANWWSAGMQQLLVPDLIAVDSVRVAARFDGPPREPRWRAASYRLYPLDSAPDQPWGRPHTRMAIDPVCTPQCRRTDCHALVEIAGRWGYRQVVTDSGATLVADVAVEDAALTVTDGAPFVPGQTLSLGGEQLTATAVAGAVVTVDRSINGTEAAAHASGVAVGIYVYPAPVVEACLQLAMRLWRGDDQTPPGRRGLGREVETLLSPYRKLPV